jgi:hypothetical protein
VVVLEGDDVGHEDIVTDVTSISADLVPRGFVSAVTVAAMLVLAACSAAPNAAHTDAAHTADASVAAAPVTAASFPALTAEVAFPRTLQAQRWVEIRVEGASGDDWVVTDATLISPFFATLAATPTNVRLFEGHVSRVRVPLGNVTCPATEEAAMVALTATHDDGAVATVEVTVPLDVTTPDEEAAPSDVLAQIHAAECETEALLAIVAPSLGDVEASAGASVDATLAITRGDSGVDERVTVTAAKGSVIFDLAPQDPDGIPATLEPGVPVVAVPVRITATRCDPHALAESKKTFVFGVWLGLGGEPERYVEVRPEAELEQALLAALEFCSDALDAQTPGGA